jgi:hypothetical protein
MHAEKLKKQSTKKIKKSIKHKRKDDTIKIGINSYYHFYKFIITSLFHGFLSNNIHLVYINGLKLKP